MSHRLLKIVGASGLAFGLVLAGAAAPALASTVPTGTAAQAATNIRNFASYTANSRASDAADSILPSLVGLNAYTLPSPSSYAGTLDRYFTYGTYVAPYVVLPGGVTDTNSMSDENLGSNLAISASMQYPSIFNDAQYTQIGAAGQFAYFDGNGYFTYAGAIVLSAAPKTAAVISNLDLTTSATSASVAWNTPATNGVPLSSYTVKLYNGADDSLVDTKDIAAGGTRNAVFTGLTTGNSYYATVTTSNTALLTSDPATTLTKVLPAPAATITVPAPVAPTTVSAAVAGSDSDTLGASWAADSNNVYYSIKVYRDGNLTYSALTADNEFLYSPTKSGSYEFSVAGYNGQTFSTATRSVAVAYTAAAATTTTTPVNDPSTTTTQDTKPVDEPSKPVTPTATATRPDVVDQPAVKAVTTTSARVTWTAPNSNGSPIKGYTVTVTAAGKTFTFTAGADTRSHLFTALPKNAVVTATVQAYNTVGAGSTSVKAPRITTTLPGKVGVIKLAKVGAHSAKLTWAKPATNGAHIKGYVVEVYKLTAGKWVLAQTWHPAATHKYLTGLASHGKYRVRVQAFTTLDAGYTTGFHGAFSAYKNITIKK